MKKNPYKIPLPTESAEQQQLFEWARLQSGACPGLAYMYHVPNGGLRNKAVAAKLKAEGVKPGVPDVCLPVPRDGYHGLYFEMKRHGEKTSSMQEQWLCFLSMQGYKTATCHGCEEAILLVCEYMGLRPPIMKG
ncbi:MAG: VRR-NUC domain-containing protein [Oscillospiraceae bacterium]